MGKTHYLNSARELDFVDTAAIARACTEMLFRLPSDRLADMLDQTPPKDGDDLLGLANSHALAGEKDALLRLYRRPRQGLCR